MATPIKLFGIVFSPGERRDRVFKLKNWSQRVLPAEGLEPTLPCGHWILSPARLPIPPRRRQGS